MRHRRVLIILAYSPLNRGDAAIVAAMSDLIKQSNPRAEVAVHSFSPDWRILRRELHAESHGGLFVLPVLGSVRRRIAWLLRNLPVAALLLAGGALGRRGLLAISAVMPSPARNALLRMARADVITAAGGGYLTDQHGLLPFFLLEIWVATRLAPTVLGAQTIGPVEKRINRSLAKLAFRRVSEIQARDDYTVRMLSRIDPALAARVRRVPDLAFAFRDLDDSASEELRAFAAGRRLLGVSVRRWHFPGSRDPSERMAAYQLAIAGAIARWTAQGDRIVLVPTNFPSAGSRDDDVRACLDIVDLLDQEARQDVYVIRQPVTPAQLRSILRDCDAFIGTRMHACILAMTVGVPSLVIAYQPKARGLMESLGRGQDVMDAEAVTTEWMVEAMQRLRHEREVGRDQVPEDFLVRTAEEAREALARWVAE